MIRSLTRVGLALSVVLSFAACGGGSSGPTTPVTPTPTPSAPALCFEGLCEEPTTNTNPVVRAQLRLYQLFDQNGTWVQPTPDPEKQVVKEPIPLGYTIRLDVVGRDADFKDTLGKQQIEFYYSDPEMVQVSIQSDFHRKLKVLKPGKFVVHAVFDGIGTNDLNFTFVEK
ncbi:MAG TPA: hypothetical protein VI589_09695 [Vicinamibacteria bacterium]